MILSKRFWLDALERAVKTSAQSLLAILGVGGTGLLDVDWGSAGSIAGLSFVLSILTSLASSNVGPGGTASLLPPPAPAPAHAPAEQAEPAEQSGNTAIST